MLLSQLITDPNRFQFRETPFSERTVAAIVAEGIDLAKFDAIPILPAAENEYCVAGDGHSRYEAIRRLHLTGNLPEQWVVDAQRDEWDIPCRIVTDAEARTLSWTANLSRDDFTPCEQARVFQAMLDSGMSMEQVCKASHRSASYVKQSLPLNGLCRDIRLAMNLSPDAGGIDAYLGKLLAAKFQQYGVLPAQQQELWHRIFKHASLTTRFVRELMDRIGPPVAKRAKDGLLFELPANIEQVVTDLKDRAQLVRRAERGLSWLLGCKDSGILDDCPDLKSFLDRDGLRFLRGIQAKVAGDAEILSELCI
jgi:ParB-like chromosome segregation protein Spo0J